MVFRIIKFQLVRIDDGVVYSVIVVVVIVNVIAVIVDGCWFCCLLAR